MVDPVLLLLNLLDELMQNQKELAQRICAFESAILEPEIDAFSNKFRKKYYGHLRDLRERGGSDKLLESLEHIESGIRELRKIISYSSQ